MIKIELADSHKNNAQHLEQQKILQQYIDTLSAADSQILDSLTNSHKITAFVDGRHLACPMPLLKTKVALRTMNEGESVYVLATDPNSQIDLKAFCQHAHLDMVFNTSSKAPRNPIAQSDLEKLDTIFHVIITKTHGN